VAARAAAVTTAVAASSGSRSSRPRVVVPVEQVVQLADGRGVAEQPGQLGEVATPGVVDRVPTQGRGLGGGLLSPPPPPGCL
jgi:hypothetical protein